MVRRALLLLVVALDLAAWLPAQAWTVSPPQYAEQWGETAGGPLTYGARRQYVRSDIPPMVISEAGFRGLAPWNQSIRQWPPQTVLLSARMGYGRVATTTTTFANNYLGASTPVTATRAVSFPRLQAYWGSARDAFDMVVPFDQPWMFDGRSDLVFELNPQPTFPLQERWVDAAAYLTARRYCIRRGQGCPNTRNWQPASLDGSSETLVSPPAYRFDLTVRDLFPNQFASLLWGTRPALATYPFLCGAVLVDGVFVGQAFSVGQNGEQSLQPMVPYEPRLTGMTLHMQAYSLDDGRHPMLLPITPTNALEVFLHPIPQRVVPAAAVFGNPGAAQGTILERDMTDIIAFR